MKILIIAAMRKELELVLHQMAECKEIETPFLKYYQGVIGSHAVSACQCGIGKVNAALNAQMLIEALKPDLVINSGVAGGLDASMKIGDILVANRICYHDVWCGPGNARGQVQGLPERFAGATDRFNIDAVTIDPKVKTGLIASGDMFVSTPDDLARVLATQPEAIAVDMESGAIAQVCHLKGVPFLAIRVVSDTPGVENHLDQYGDFWSLAPQSTFGILRRILL